MCADASRRGRLPHHAHRFATGWVHQPLHSQRKEPCVGSARVPSRGVRPRQRAEGAGRVARDLRFRPRLAAVERSCSRLDRMEAPAMVRGRPSSKLRPVRSRARLDPSRFGFGRGAVAGLPVANRTARRAPRGGSRIAHRGRPACGDCRARRERARLLPPSGRGRGGRHAAVEPTREEPDATVGCLASHKHSAADGVQSFDRHAREARPDPSARIHHSQPRTAAPERSPGGPRLAFRRLAKAGRRVARGG